MNASGNGDAPHQIRRQIVCPDCGQEGTVSWVEIDASPRLVSLTGGFHPESGRTSSGQLLIICDACDAILPSHH